MSFDKRIPTTFVCIICIDDLFPETADDYNVATTCCYHVFHKKCIEGWIKQQRTPDPAHPSSATPGAPCPNCETRVTMTSCRKLYLNAENAESRAKARYEEGQRVRQELAETEERLKEMKRNYDVLKNRYDSLMEAKEKSAGTVKVVKDSGVQILSVKAAPTSAPNPRTEYMHEDRIVRFNREPRVILVRMDSLSTPNDPAVFTVVDKRSHNPESTASVPAVAADTEVDQGNNNE